MIKFRVVIILLLVIVCSTMSFAATNIDLPSKAMGKPLIFTNITYSYRWQELADRRDWRELTNQSWVVYADRHDVPLYGEPSKYAKEIGKMNFLQECFIATIKGDYALVYDEQYVQQDLKISSKAKAYGWIRLDNLLLWSECPRTQSQVYQKAVILKDVDAIQNKNSVDINETSPRFFEDPEGKTKSKKRAKDLEFYFIYKLSSDGSALLMKESKIESRTLNTNAMGWMKAGMFTQWNERLCYEPNFDEDEAGGTAAIFIDKKDARKYKMDGLSENSNNVIWKDVLPSTRWNTRKMRFPVIEFDNNSFLAQVGTISSFGKIASKDQKIIEQTQVKLDQLINKSRRINVVFVIDGTSSMTKYYKPMSNAIVNAMQRNSLQGMEIYFGAVVYRNAADKENEIEVSNLSREHKQLAQWLVNRNVKSVGQSHQESMYKGIETAIDRMSWESENANFLILVGDAGNVNDKQSDKIAQLADKMTRKEINFVSFQVNHPDHIAYHDFVSQSQKLLNQSLTKSLGRKVNKEEWKIIGRLSSFVKTDFPPVAAAYQYAGINVSINASELTELIEDRIVSFSSITQDGIASLNALLNGLGGAEVGGQFTNDFKEVLRKRGFSDEQIRILQEQNTTLKVKGWTSRVADKTTAFTPCVFFAQDELRDLIQQLSEVTRSVSANRRSDLQKALMQLASSYLGQSTDDINVDDLMEAITSVKQAIGGSIMQGISIKDITNPAKVTDYQISTFIKRLENDLARLKRCQTDKSNYFESVNGLIYYYILLEDMPFQQ